MPTHSSFGFRPTAGPEDRGDVAIVWIVSRAKGSFFHRYAQHLTLIPQAQPVLLYIQDEA